VNGDRTTRFSLCRAAAAAGLLAGLASGVGADPRPQGDAVTVRVLPQAVATNAAPTAFRMGFQVGLLEGSGNPFRAECAREETVGGSGGGVTVHFLRDPAAGRSGFVAANAGERPGEVGLSTVPLRKGVRHSVRVVCRCVKGRGRFRFVFSPVGGEADATVEKKVSVRSDVPEERLFAVTPPREGVYRCAFVVEPGSELEFRQVSVVPDDADKGFSPQPMEALRAVAPGAMHWPSRRDVSFYNWYDGVGPLAQRRSVSRVGRTEEGHDFGTVEFVAFSRLAGAEPVIRVPLFQAGLDDERVPDLAAGAQLAADWVAYCNATGDHPLAVLRSRHGHPEPLQVRRWELVAADGGRPAAAAVSAYAAAMTNAWAGLDLRVGEAPVCGVYDRYVAGVMNRLWAAGEAEQGYFGEWYATLGLAYAGLECLRRGPCGDVSTPFHPEEVLFRALYAKNMLTEAGLLMALFNRHPAAEPLVTEGAPSEPDAPFRVQAAWTEGRSALVIFVYNSGPEARAVKLDLTPLRRRFAFWIEDQLAADITSRRAARTVPVNRTQRAGAALTQYVVCEAAPSSFTRILVQEVRGP